VMKSAFRPWKRRSAWSSLDPNNRSQMESPPSPCHPEAQPRDLQFSGPFVEMFFDRAKRSGEICGSTESAVTVH
jgi:hypothetical protein